MTYRRAGSGAWPRPRAGRRGPRGGCFGRQERCGFLGPWGAWWDQFLLKIQSGRQSMVLRMVAQGLLAGAAGAGCGLVTGKVECGLGAGEDPSGTGGSADPLRTVCSTAWISEEKTLGQLRGTIWKLRWRDRPLGGIASNSPGAHKGKTALMEHHSLLPQR